MDTSKLTPEQYNICFLKGTEPPGSGKYYKNFSPGSYHCVVCNQKLFDSDTKYDSGTGWPAFWDTMPNSVKTAVDESHSTTRTEVMCGNCGSHLGHVFNDGPKEKSGMRYCINSLALNFVPEK